jgi:antitoxin PrlF
MNSAYSITSKYQVTIPKDVREQVGLQDGDRVSFVAEGDTIIVRKVRSLKDVADKIAKKVARQNEAPASEADYKRARQTFYEKGDRWQ